MIFLTRFVIPTGLDEATVSEALAQAFEACREADMTPEWMEEERVEAIGPTKTVTFIMGELVSPDPALAPIMIPPSQDVFVMDPFSGPGFEHLTSDDKFRCSRQLRLAPSCDTSTSGARWWAPAASCPA